MNVAKTVTELKKAVEALEKSVSIITDELFKSEESEEVFQGTLDESTTEPSGDGGQLGDTPSPE